MVTSRWRPNAYHDNLMTLYNIPWHGSEDPREMRPTFGSARLPLLNQVEASDDGLYAPTMPALIQHFSFMQEVMDDSEFWATLQQKPRILKWMNRGMYQEFYEKVLDPTREQLEKRRHIYLYNSPKMWIETDKKTGVPAIKVSGEQILKALPMSKQVAEVYGMSKEEIQAIAPEVLYILDKKKGGYRTLREERDLITRIDGWLAYIPTGIRDQFYKSIKKSSPCIVASRKAKQLLLF